MTHTLKSTFDSKLGGQNERHSYASKLPSALTSVLKSVSFLNIRLDVIISSSLYTR